MDVEIEERVEAKKDVILENLIGNQLLTASIDIHLKCPDTRGIRSERLVKCKNSLSLKVFIISTFYIFLWENQPPEKWVCEF